MKDTIKSIISVLIALAGLALLEVGIRILGIEPPSREEWSAQYGVYTVERYFAQAPAHFDKKDGICSTAQIMSGQSDRMSRAMQPQTFACSPAKNRVVLLGGSSVQGYGLDDEHTAASQLSSILPEEWDVVNAGVAGYNSLQIRRMLPEIWTLEPSLLVLYSGHNDFVFYPMIEQALSMSSTQLQLRGWLDNSALWRWMRQQFHPLSQVQIEQPRRPSFDEQARAAFNQRPLPAATNKEQITKMIETQQDVLQNIKTFYRENIQTIVAEAKDRGVQVLLVVPVSRIDSPPVDGIHWNRLETQELQRWNELWMDIQKAPPKWGDSQWSELFALDDSYAPALHLAGNQAWKKEQRADAIRLWSTSNLYMPPSRSIVMPSSFGDWIIETGEQTSVPVLDLRPIWNEAAEQPNLPAGDLFLDSVHFNERASGLFSELIVQFIEKNSEAFGD